MIAPSVLVQVPPVTNYLLGEEGRGGEWGKSGGKRECSRIPLRTDVPDPPTKKHCVCSLL